MGLPKVEVPAVSPQKYVLGLDLRRWGSTTNAWVWEAFIFHSSFWSQNQKQKFYYWQVGSTSAPCHPRGIECHWFPQLISLLPRGHSMFPLSQKTTFDATQPGDTAGMAGAAHYPWKNNHQGLAQPDIFASKHTEPYRLEETGNWELSKTGWEVQGGGCPQDFSHPRSRVGWHKIRAGTTWQRIIGKKPSKSIVNLWFVHACNYVLLHIADLGTWRSKINIASQTEVECKI